MGKVNRWELVQMQQGMAKQLEEATLELNKMYMDSGTDKAAREVQKSTVEDLKERLEGINRQVVAFDAEATERLRKTQNTAAGKNPEEEKMIAKGKFYKAVLTGENAGEVAKAASTFLGAIPAGDAALGGGENLLPTNMTSELIVEPAVENPMRKIVRMSNITGLEEPKISFEIDGTAFDDITDKQTAKEIKMGGASVSYGRHKVKVRAKISDTVLHGSPINLAQEVENALRSGLAMNEMLRQFAESPGTGYEEMSFYSTKNAVKVIQGESLQQGIAKALADLPLAFRRNAKIVMSALDWYGMWGDNLNQSGTYYEERPLILFGKPVELVDDATKPVVGDFNYARINYDIGSIYDTDKDVDEGVYKFILTAWYDIKLRLKSAFRVVEEVTPTNP